MSNDILSQEEIDALLSGSANIDMPYDELEEADKDLLGEIGNICMGSAATTLSILINQPVSITTPKVKLCKFGELRKEFNVPNVCIEVRFISGLNGANLLVLKVPDAKVIASLMMGGMGDKGDERLTEIEMSAVSEAMNQMIGTAATSMSTMFKSEINISPPYAHIWDNSEQKMSDFIGEEDKIVQVSFRLTIGTMVDSEIMQLLPLQTAKEIIEAMTQGFKEPQVIAEQPKKEETPIQREVEDIQVHKAQFAPLEKTVSESQPRNIDLILDVPIEVSVILGKSKKTIKEILELNNGSLIELDKLVEEPVDILVNGKMVAQGEVVVVNENFGVRITNIVSNAERVKGLKN